jgi:RING finger protein 113A
MASADVTVPFFKKKGKARPTTTRRQRSSSPDASAPSPAGPLASSSSTKTEVVLPTRKAGANLLSAGTKRKRTGADGTGVAEADDELDARDGPDVQWTAAGSHRHAAQAILDGDEAAALLLAKRARNAPDEDDEDVPDDGLYRGQAAYKSHLVKSKEVPKAMRAGPQRNASTIRQVTIVDYQPDTCKDYRGACGNIDSLSASVC